MSVAFIDRNPTEQEVELLRLTLSTFGDGSGMLTNGDHTLPGWRDFERVVAAVLKGSAPEWKGIFDVIVPSPLAPDVDYGLSIKSKALSRASAIDDLALGGRVYIELTNSPAKMWNALKRKGIDESAVRSKEHAQDVGDTMLATVEAWHKESEKEHLKRHLRRLELSSSRFLVLSYKKRKATKKQKASVTYQWHSFSLEMPEGVIWRYRSEKSLMGLDPARPTEVLFDFYPFSGGQLKYYPRASSALYHSAVFQLENPVMRSVLTKASRYYTQLWQKAGGQVSIEIKDILQELGNMSLMTQNDDIRRTLEDASFAVARFLPKS